MPGGAGRRARPGGHFYGPVRLQVDAVDPLLDQYAGMLPHFQPADYPYVRFFSQTLESFLVKMTMFVFCLNAINHVANLDSSLDRLVALVQPGGYLLLSVDAHNYHWIRYLFQRLPADILHPHQFTCTEYANAEDSRVGDRTNDFDQKIRYIQLLPVRCPCCSSGESGNPCF